MGFSRYFKRQLNPKQYGKETVKELVELIKDTMVIDKEQGILKTVLSEEAETLTIFVKQAENIRRDRQRRLDAGDETARLNFTLLKQMQTKGWGQKAAVVVPPPPGFAGKGANASKGKGAGKNPQYAPKRWGK